MKIFRRRLLNGKGAIGNKGLLLVGLCWVITGCGGMATQKLEFKIRLSDIQVDEKAVERMSAYLRQPKVSFQGEIPETLKVLFTFLSQTSPDQLAETKPHAKAKWDLDRIYLLDDCVAVQLVEGHYMETIFFAKNRKGWHVAARIRPKDHL